VFRCISVSLSSVSQCFNTCIRIQSNSYPFLHLSYHVTRPQTPSNTSTFNLSPQVSNLPYSKVRNRFQFLTLLDGLTPPPRQPLSTLIPPLLLQPSSISSAPPTTTPTYFINLFSDCIYTSFSQRKPCSYLQVCNLVLRCVSSTKCPLIRGILRGDRTTVKRSSFLIPVSF
jgi:hypothetical protein